MKHRKMYITPPLKKRERHVYYLEFIKEENLNILAYFTIRLALKTCLIIKYR